jgi:hypothetical protein
MTLTVSSQVTQAAAVLRAMLLDYRAGYRADELYERDHDALWAGLAADGWLAAADPDGALPDLRSVAELAEAWGAALIPLPYLETLLVRRVSAGFRDAGPASRPATFPLPAAGGGLNWPFGGDGIEPAGLGTVALPENGVKFDQAGLDQFAPSLPLAHTDGAGAGARGADLTQSWQADALALYAAAGVGAASVALESSIAHASQREAFGQAVVRFQAIRHRLADMYRDLELARSAAYWACQPVANRVTAAAISADLARSVLEGAAQVHGGMGFTWELGLHFRTRHVLAVRKLITGVQRG